MPRSKHKNGKLKGQLIRKLKRSKNPSASKLKLRNKSGGGSGSRSPTRPARAASYLSGVKKSTRSPSSPIRSSRSSRSSPAGPAKAASPRSRSQSPPPSRRRSPRRSSSSKSSRSASNNSKKPKGLKSILQGPMAQIVLDNLTSQQLARFAQASTNTYRTVETVYPTSSDIRYKNLIDIYDNPKFKKVIKKIEQIDLTDKKNNYLQTPDKLKEIQEVYKNKKNPELTEKEDKIKRINDLIAIFFKYRYKTITGKDPLDKYMKYLKQTSKKQFDKYSEDIEDIEIGIAILTLFYGFDDSDMFLIFSYTEKNPEILKDYIYLLNELFTKQKGTEFYAKFDVTLHALGVSQFLNRAGIEEYVKRRTTSGVIDKYHEDVYNKLIRDTDFKKKYARSG